MARLEQFREGVRDRDGLLLDWLDGVGWGWICVDVPFSVVGGFSLVLTLLLYAVTEKGADFISALLNCSHLGSIESLCFRLPSLLL
jgi:hypothetical protein